VGVGKTSVLLELGERLSAGDLPYAIVDLDWLAWLRPDPVSAATVQDVLCENLGHVSRTFASAGVARIALARAARSTREVDEIRAALGASELVVVRLVASPELIEQRLRKRDSGAQLAEHLAEAGSFAAEAEAAGIGDVLLETDGLDPAAVAQRVLDASGWSGSG
jgi:hypothetical protein